MKVILFRHGPAGSYDPARWPDDRERPLTPKGVERTRMAASGLVRIEPAIDAVLTSPLTRALETAKLLTEAIGSGTPHTVDALAMGTTGRGVAAAIGQHVKADGTVVLVGHEPDLGRMAANWIGHPGSLPLKKAGACAVEITGAPRAGAGTLLWYVPPRVLRRLGRKGGRVREEQP